MSTNTVGCDCSALDNDRVRRQCVLALRPGAVEFLLRYLLDDDTCTGVQEPVRAAACTASMGTERERAGRFTAPSGDGVVRLVT